MTTCLQTYTPHCVAAPHRWCERATPDPLCPKQVDTGCVQWLFDLFGRDLFAETSAGRCAEVVP